jgi:poly(rC)-binding protein 2/3/4
MLPNTDAKFILFELEVYCPFIFEVNHNMFYQIVGEIRAARNALMQVTTKLRSYLYREMYGPNQIGSINVHGSISPVKDSPRGLYPGNDLPMAMYQQAPQMTTSWHSKVSPSLMQQSIIPLCLFLFLRNPLKYVCP